MKESEAAVCPACQAKVPVTPGYVAWCECGWNLGGEEAPERDGLLGRIYRRLGHRRGLALFENVRQRQDIRPTVTVQALLSILLSVTVLATTPLLAAGAVAMVIAWWPNLFAVAGAGILLLVAAFLWPRPLPVPKGRLVPRTECPALWEFIERLARIVDVPVPRYVAITSDFNACAARVGFRQRRILELGLPLLVSYEPQEWVALTGHELAHFRNGDVTHGIVTGAALATLERWYAVLKPERISGVDGGPPEMVARLMLLALSWLPRSGLFVLGYLVYDDWQREEYYADRLGAAAGGTEARIGSLERHLMTDLVERAAHAVVVGGKADVLSEIRDLSRSLPPRERERLRRLAASESSSLDSTHPPTGLRIRMLKESAPMTARTALTSEQAESILRELSPTARRVNRELVDWYRVVALDS